MAPRRLPLRSLFLVALVLLLTLAPSSYAQKFNAFKSYKDAKVKPANYGRIERRTHDVEEYLSSNQLKMLQSRRGPDRPGETFDDKWSGFKQFKELRAAKKALQTQSGAEKNSRRRLSASSAEISTSSGVFDVLVNAPAHLSFLALSALFFVCVGACVSLSKREKQAIDAERWPEKFSNMAIRRKGAATIMAV